VLLARLPETIICGAITPSEHTQPIFFAFNPFSVIPFTRCPPEGALAMHSACPPFTIIVIFVAPFVSAGTVWFASLPETLNPKAAINH